MGLPRLHPILGRVVGVRPRNVLALAHELSIPVLMAVFGLASLFNDAASQSFLPRLVPPELLTPANARLDQSGAVAQTCGPALADAVGYRPMLWVAAVGLMAVAISLTFSPFRHADLGADTATG